MKKSIVLLTCLSLLVISCALFEDRLAGIYYVEEKELFLHIERLDHKPVVNFYERRGDKITLTNTVKNGPVRIAGKYSPRDVVLSIDGIEYKAFRLKHKPENGNFFHDRFFAGSFIKGFAERDLSDAVSPEASVRQLYAPLGVWDLVSVSGDYIYPPSKKKTERLYNVKKSKVMNRIVVDDWELPLNVVKTVPYKIYRNTWGPNSLEVVNGTSRGSYHFAPAEVSINASYTITGDTMIIDFSIRSSYDEKYSAVYKKVVY
jgi:hypothetical protein